MLILLKTAKIATFLLLLCLSFASEAQTKKAIETEMYNIYQDAINEFYSGTYDRSLETIKKAENKALGIDDYEFLIDCNFFRILVYNKQKNWLQMSSITDVTLQLAKKHQFYPNSTYVKSHLDYYQALTHFVKGEYEQSLVYFEAVSDTLFRYQGQDLYTIFAPEDLLNNTAVVYQKIGEYGKSMSYLKKAIALVKKNEFAIAKMYNQLAFSLAELDQNEEAAKYYLEGLTKIAKFRQVRQAVDFEIAMCQNLAGLYLKKSQLDSAAYYLQKSKLLQPDSFQIAKNLSLEGALFLKKKEFEKSKLSFFESLKISEQLYSLKSPQYGLRLYHIGKLLIEHNQPNEGLQFLQRALCTFSWEFDDEKNISKNPSTNSTGIYPNLIETLQTKSQALAKTGEKELALETYQRAISIFQTFRQTTLKTKMSKLHWQKKVKNLLESAIQLAININADELAFQCSQESHGLLLRENIHQLQIQQYGEYPDSLIQKEHNLKIKINDLELSLFQEKSIFQQEKINQQLFDAQYELATFLKTQKNNYPDYFQKKYELPTASIAKIQQYLCSDEDALIEYFVGAKQIFIFVITANDFKVYAQTKPVEFSTWIADIRTTLNQNNRNLKAYETYTSAAYQLYQLLLESVIKDFPNVTNFKVIPDAELGYIPLKVLLSKPVKITKESFSNYKSLAYLVKKYNFSYDYSSALFIDLQEFLIPQKEENFLGFAPSFPGKSTFDRSESLDSLLFNKKEVATIKKIVGGRIFLDSTATKEAFIQNLDNAKILHLSTHAEFNDRYPTKSPIHLYDNHITVGEIYNLHIPIDLAVLSACETGTGELRRGEGIMSLARSFMHAGCPSVVTSLWKVKDKQTPVIMQYFYENTFAGERKDLALSNAQRRFLNEVSSNSLAHPHYWGAFIQVGNAKPIVHSNIGYWLGGVGVLGLVLLIFFGKRRSFKTTVSPNV